MPTEDELAYREEFEARFAGVFKWWADDQFVYLSLSYSPDLVFGSPPPFQMRVPLSLFADEEQIGEWVGKTWAKFKGWWTRAVYFETNQHMSDAANFYLGEMGLSSFGFDDMVKGRSKASADDLKRRFDKPVGRGRRSPWDKPTLEAVVKSILFRRPSLTWDAIRDEIALMYPQATPASGEALRVRAHDLGLSLRVMKSEVRKHKRRVNE